MNWLAYCLRPTPCEPAPTQPKPAQQKKPAKIPLEKKVARAFRQVQELSFKENPSLHEQANCIRAERFLKTEEARSIKKLNVSLTTLQPLTEKAIKILVSFEKLEELTLANMDGLPLERLPIHLRVLSLTFCNLNDHQSQHFFRFHQLTHLTLTSNHVGDETARAVACLRTLEVCDLENNEITLDGARELITLPRLRELKLGCNPFEDSDTTEELIRQGLQRNIHLRLPLAWLDGKRITRF